MHLSQFCVYTMRHTDDLNNVYENKGGSGAFVENKRWAEGSRLFQDAQRRGEQMPILFSAAEKEGGLLYYAILTSVELDDSDPEVYRTKYSFAGLTRLVEEPPKSSLVKKSNNKPLSDDYIRPYAICYTPSFL